MSRQAPGGYAFVFNLFDAEPVFHAWRQITMDGSTWRTNDGTACGISLPFDSATGSRGVTSIPEQHAVKFARPCRRCYPPGAKVNP